MAATGASPTYFNYDNFEEIQVSTAGNDIKARTGGIGLNFVVKRGTNQFRGSVRGYFDNDVDGVVERARRAEGRSGVTPRDVRPQRADLGLRRRDRRTDLAATRRGSTARIRSRTCAWCGAPATLIDRTQLKNPNVKVNWQATQKDISASCIFDGFKIKDGRSPGITGITFDAPTATYHQDNAYDRQAAARAVEDRRRPRVRHRSCSCRACTPTTTPGSSSIRSAGWISRPAATS